jgi:hypothetical protein
MEETCLQTNVVHTCSKENSGMWPTYSCYLWDIFMFFVGHIHVICGTYCEGNEKHEARLHKKRTEINNQQTQSSTKRARKT